MVIKMHAPHLNTSVSLNMLIMPIIPTATKRLMFQFYKSDAICSEPILFAVRNVTKDGICHGVLTDDMFRAEFSFNATTNLLWCLKEEPIELQVSCQSVLTKS